MAQEVQGVQEVSKLLTSLVTKEIHSCFMPAYTVKSSEIVRSRLWNVFFPKSFQS